MSITRKTSAWCAGDDAFSGAVKGFPRLGYVLIGKSFQLVCYRRQACIWEKLSVAGCWISELLTTT